MQFIKSETGSVKQSIRPNDAGAQLREYVGLGESKVSAEDRSAVQTGVVETDSAGILRDEQVPAGETGPTRCSRCNSPCGAHRGSLRQVEHLSGVGDEAASVRRYN